MSEPRSSTRSEASASASEWLTVGQAAAIIGVSEKTLRKRIAGGEVAAERQKLSAGGWAWRVDGTRLEGATEGSNRFQPRDGKSFEHDGAGSGVEVPTASNRATEAHGSVTEEVPTAQMPILQALQVPDARDEMVVELRDQVKFLRAAVEQHQRSEAELRAALRTALAAMPKALPDGESSTRSVVNQSAENGAESSKSEPMRQQTPNTKNAAQRHAAREMRPLWKVILGIR